MQATSKEVVRRAIRTSSVPARMWSPGQWVYCFRRGKAGDTLHPTPRRVARASLYSTLDLSFGLPCEQGCGVAPQNNFAQRFLLKCSAAN